MTISGFYKIEMPPKNLDLPLVAQQTRSCNSGCVAKAIKCLYKLLMWLIRIFNEQMTIYLYI